LWRVSLARLRGSSRSSKRAATTPCRPKDFLEQGLPFVSIIGDDHVCTIEEFSLTIINDQAA